MNWSKRYKIHNIRMDPSELHKCTIFSDISSMLRCAKSRAFSVTGNCREHCETKMVSKFQSYDGFQMRNFLSCPQSDCVESSCA